MYNMRLEKFFVFGLRKFSRKIDEVLILMILPNIRPPVVEKVEESDQIFFISLVVSRA